MIALARNRSISDAVLVSGDEDIRVGVQQAQEFGVRVHLIGIKPSRGSQSLFLLQESDTTHEWGPDELAPFLSCKPKIVALEDLPRPSAVAVQSANAPVTVDPLEAVAAAVALSLDVSELASLLEAHESTRQLPRDVDRRLLSGGRGALRRDLEPSEKQQVRRWFVEACRRRLT